MNTQAQTSGHPDRSPRAWFTGAFGNRRRLLFILVFDATNLRLLDANDNATQQYGFERDEFLQMTLKDLVPRARFSRLLRFVHNMPEQLMSTIVCEHRKRDGSTMPVEMQCYKFLFQNQPAVVALTREIAGSAQLEHILEHAPRGRVAGASGSTDILSRVDRRLMYLELHREIDRLAGQSADAIRDSGAGRDDPDWADASASDGAMADMANPQSGSWFSGWSARLGWRRFRRPHDGRIGALQRPPDDDPDRA